MDAEGAHILLRATGALIRPFGIRARRSTEPSARRSQDLEDRAAEPVSDRGAASGNAGRGSSSLSELRDTPLSKYPSAPPAAASATGTSSNPSERKHQKQLGALCGTPEDDDPRGPTAGHAFFARDR